MDDLGAHDLACTGSQYYETPEIDRFCKQGMQFTQAYAACCVCSPTRAALLTGESSARLHLTDWIAGHKRPKAKLKVPDFNLHLPLETTTIAEVFKAAGYATASIGKWHLGGVGSLPEQHGFDLNIGGTDKGQPPSYFSPYKIETLSDGPKGEYITDRLTREAESFIEQHQSEPFLLYLPHFAVHTPLQAKEESVKYFKAKEAAGTQHNATYAAMIKSTDESVGRILKKLDALKLTEKTIVIFTSDNGGLTSARGGGPTNNAPLREGKGSPYEGGTRVPLFVRYPPLIKAGTTCDVPTISQDLFPTLIDLAGIPKPATMPSDSVSLAAAAAAGWEDQP